MNGRNWKSLSESTEAICSFVFNIFYSFKKVSPEANLPLNLPRERCSALSGA